MKSEDIENLKILLTSQLNDLLTHANRSFVGLQGDSLHLPDPLDRANYDSERTFALHIRGRESRLIRKIKSALEKIEDGEYGICEMCGEDISVARLKARPVASLCIRCKTKQEAIEKASGF